MLRKKLSRVIPVLMVAFLAACTQNLGKTSTDGPSLEQAKADNVAMINLFGSDGSGVPLVIRNIYDLNRNGQFDDFEASIPGWGIRLTRVDAQGVALAASELQVTPESNGQRWQGVFVNVPAGSYKLEELSPRPLSGVSWNVSSSASRTLNLQGTELQAVEFSSVCLENAQAVPFPEATALDTWKCKPSFDLAPRIASFTLSPNEVQTGERPKFAWTVTDNATLEIDEGIGALPNWTGSQELEASDSARYTLTARNAFGSSQAQVSLRVKPKTISGAFSSAGSTPGTVFTGTAGSRYFQTPGLLLGNGNVVVGKIPYESIALDGPVQTRIRGFYLFDPSSSSFSTLGQIQNPKDTESFRYSLEDAFALDGSRAVLHKIPEVTNPLAAQKYERYDFATDEYIVFEDGPAGPTYSDAADVRNQEALLREFVVPNKVIMVISCVVDPRHPQTQVRIETYHMDSGATDRSHCTSDPENQVPHSEFTLLPNGTFLVTGGQYGVVPSTRTSSSLARIYDPLAMTYRRLSNMKYPRYLHSVTPLVDGRFLISGGTAGSGVEKPLKYVLGAEIFDPRTETFNKVGNLLEGRLEPTVPRGFQLATGKVLLLDTYHPNDPTAKTIFKPELFDPITGQFSATGDFLEPRFGFSAVQLKDGRIFVYGGISSDGVPLSSAEIYTP
jgi:Galactose oxidase, central domain